MTTPISTVDRLDFVVRSLPLRQRQILKFACNGYHREEIAKLLNVTSKTVSYHIGILHAMAGWFDHGHRRISLVYLFGLWGGRGSSAGARKAWTGLTATQKEVATQAVSDLLAVELGAILSMAPGTVQKHLIRIYEATGVSNREEFILWYMSHIATVN